MLVKKFQPDISIEYNSYHLNRDGQFLWFIQTPEIVDIEKYILQKSGMRDSSQSNNGLHGSITTRKREFQLSSLNVLVSKIQDYGWFKTYNIYVCLIMFKRNWEILVEENINLFCEFSLCYYSNPDTFSAIK